MLGADGKSDRKLFDSRRHHGYIRWAVRGNNACRHKDILPRIRHKLHWYKLFGGCQLYNCSCRHTHTYANSDSDPHSDSDADSYAHTHTNANTHAKPDTNADPDADTQSDASNLASDDPQ